MEVRCPIHGLISYNALEERVINSRVMQRLRGIRQLAMACLVYPGAVHTRFDHSLGVMHVAGTMAELLGLRGEEWQNIRLAGLLHDVGHGPFSHVSEIPLAVLSANYAERRAIDLEKLHECITVDVINHDHELREILEGRREAIARLIDSVKYLGRTVARQIISGPLDADKLDYLLRDSHFCGVKYGVYDLERVLNGLTPISEAASESSVGIKHESVWAVEQHLMARYHMTIQVYRHRVRRSTDLLLARAALLAAQAEIADIADLYTYSGPRKAFTERWLSYSDYGLLCAIMRNGRASRAAKLVSCLNSRALSFSVLSIPLDRLGTFYQSRVLTPAEQQELEKRVANKCSVDRDRVIVDVVRTEPPRPSSSEPAIDLDRDYALRA